MRAKECSRPVNGVVGFKSFEIHDTPVTKLKEAHGLAKLEDNEVKRT